MTERVFYAVSRVFRGRRCESDVLVAFPESMENSFSAFLKWGRAGRISRRDAVREFGRARVEAVREYALECFDLWHDLPVIVECYGWSAVAREFDGVDGGEWA